MSTLNDQTVSPEAVHDHALDLPRLPSAPGRLPATARLTPRAQIFLMQAPGAAAQPQVAPEDAVAAAGGSTGQPLPAALRTRFESSLGADLSAVRVHTGAASATAARSLHARAYATGDDIHFNDGEYQPGDPFGVHLLAHEVAHTVQQRGAASPPQTKLEVSGRGDACEVEADRAADAMVRGAPAAVSHGAPAIARDPLPTNPLDPVAPKPRNWDAESGGGGPLVSGTWSGAPAFSMVAWSGGVTPEVADAQRRVGDGKARFSADWGAAQANFNRVATEMDKYNTASKDAEEKGVMDVPTEGSGTLDINLEDAKLPGQDTTVGQAFNGKGDVAGQYDPSKIPAAKRKDVDASKKKVDDAERVLGSAYRTAHSAELDLNSAATALNNAGAASAQVMEEVKKEKLQTEFDLVVRNAALSAQTVAALVGAGNAAARGGIPDPTAAAGLINTFAWEGPLRDLLGQMQAIQGAIQQLRKIQALGNLEIARNNVLKAIDAVKTAHATYLTAKQAKTTAYSELASKVADATASGGAPKQASANMSAAIQAVPAIEYVVDVTGTIGAMIAIPAYSDLSGIGCTLASNADQMIGNVAALKETRTEMKLNNDKWKKRLDSVRKLIAGTGTRVTTPK